MDAELVSELAEAWADPAVQGLERPVSLEQFSGESQAAACFLAVRLGRCLLAGAKPSELKSQRLPVPVALAAAARLAALAPEWTEAARRLGDDWDNATDQFEADNFCCNLLEARMGAWAATSAIEQVREALEPTDETPASAELLTLDKALDAVYERLGEFDNVLYEQKELLSVVIDLPFLDNWRDVLNVEKMEIVPWWFDGTLEAAAQAVWDKAIATMPGPEDWEKVQRALGKRGEPVPVTCRIANRTISAWPKESLPKQSTMVSLAAAGRSTTRPTVLYWRSPDQQYEARLEFSPTERESTEDMFRLEFANRKGLPPAELSEQPVRLAGVEAQIAISEESAAALFSQDAVDQADEDLTLTVGKDDVVWQPAGRSFLEEPRSSET